MKNVMGEIQTRGNIDTAGATSMTIDSGAIGKLMGMFSNQYSNKNLAVIREYFCNGDDSRIAAGSERPTEVFLPTDLQPSLLIRDFGLGLDKEGLVKTFATYGLSTKGETNDQTGAFGIGSKAAFTMGQQFIVTGFKDGVKTTALFSLDKHGVGQVSIEHEGPTTEPNGVLVSLAVPNVEAMHRAARKFFSTVPKGRALVDGAAPEHLFDTVEVSRITDQAVIVKDGEGEVRVQMGPVVYPVNREIRLLVAKRLKDTDAAVTANALVNWEVEDSLLFEVDMGALTIAPSREDLRDTDATVDSLTAVVAGIAQHLVSSIQTRLDSCKAYYEAAMVLHEEMSLLKAFKVKRDAFTFNGGGKFKHEITVEIPTLFLADKSWRSRSKAKTLGRDDKFTTTPERAQKTLVVAGVPKDEISKVSRYAKRFLESQDADGIKWLMVAEEASGATEWFEFGTPGGALTWSLDDYRAALRAMRTSNPRTRTEPSYTSTWYGEAEKDVDDRDLLTDLIAEGKPLLVFNSHAYVSPFASDILEPLYTPVVLMPTQSVNALRKRVEADGSVEV